jgi:RHS repeat-associated protein
MGCLKISHNYLAELKIVSEKKDVRSGKTFKKGRSYLEARYYNPRISNWLSVDPLAESTMQPYQYANNNPIRYIDPTGLKGEDWVEQESGKVIWDSRVKSQADAEKYWGDKSKHYAPNNLGKYDKGGNYHFYGENAQIVVDGKEYKAPDMAGKEPLSTKINNAYKSEFTQGAVGVVGGVVAVGLGIAACLTGGGCAAGAGAITLGVPAVGFGMARMTNSMDSNSSSNIPGGLMEGVDVGVGGNGAVGETLDIGASIITGGFPKTQTIVDKVETANLLYETHNSKVGESIIKKLTK